MRTLLVGTGAAMVGLGGTLVGLFVAYPGRAFTLIAVMLGVPLVVMGRQSRGTTA